MFPIDGEDYNADFLQKYNALVADNSMPRLSSILPKPRRAGEDAGKLTADGASLLGLPESAIGIPVAAAEGDQVASLAGSLIGRDGLVSCSFGTSVCANVVAPKGHHFEGVSSAVDHFAAADGKPIHMVWLRNGTTFLNTIVASYGNDFARIMPQLIEAAPDCGGLVALPFMDDEPGLGVSQGGSASIVGLNAENSTPGNVAKAALLATMFNLKIGCQVLIDQGIELRQLVLSGGLAKTPECGQILADVFGLPVQFLEAADEGCSWGAAVLAKYRYLVASGLPTEEWSTFLDSISGNRPTTVFDPIAANVPLYDKQFARYQKLIRLQEALTEVVSSSS